MSEPTPRYGHQPIKMQRVAAPEEVGEFRFHNPNGIHGTLHIEVVVPAPLPDDPQHGVWQYLPVKVGPANQDASRNWGWDGNEEAPTLTPSIHTIGHWHGFIRNGFLVEA